MSKQQEEGASRRDFLKMAGTAAPAAAAAAMLSGHKAEAAEAPVDDTRMQDTAHTRAYLESVRF